MPVYSVWESHFPPEQMPEGRVVTEAIWRDMTQLDGYLTHDLIEDLDDPGHLLLVSQWSSRGRADEVLQDYADNPNARLVNELVSRRRTRFVGQAVPGAA